MSVDFPKSLGSRMRTKDVPRAGSSGDWRSRSKAQWNKNMKPDRGSQLIGSRGEQHRKDRIHGLKDVKRPRLKRTSASGVFVGSDYVDILDSQSRMKRRTSFSYWRDIKLPPRPSLDSSSVGSGLSRAQLALALTLFTIVGCAEAATLPDRHYSPSSSRGLAEERLGIRARQPTQQLINLNSLQLPALHGAGAGKSLSKVGPNTLPTDRAQNDNAYGSSTGPRFDMSIPRNLTVQEGQTAILSCRVLNLAEKTVSWIRLHNLHVLTVDKYKYSTDPRVSVVHNEASQEWVLRIRVADKTDAGQYECQISTKPVLSYTVSVQVIVPRAEILNGPDLYVHQGSLINLTCVVHHGTDRPVFVYWYHGDKLMEYEGDREGVTVITEAEKNTISHLLVRNATLTDTGHYTCKPSNGNKASINLHVLQGEYQAAMQTNGAESPMTQLCTPFQHLIIIHVMLVTLVKTMLHPL